LGVDVDLEALRAELEEVEARLDRLDPVPFLDVGAGPGVFTGIVPGTAFALDQSDAALQRLRTVLAAVPVVCGDATALPVRAKSVVRLFAGHLYGHLEPPEREVFLTEARRVADELVILDSGRPLGAQAEEWQSRRLDDGSTFTVYKRHLTVEELAREISGEALFGGRYYVLARSVA
jgi:ubiquinone/menaquinone biosynthesis C-methylase UbiE